ncbi:MAG: hypothetical protein M1300_11090 [Epsilonproteobacteria bacterium]|nr:hypothetical protein [Campylobacterota bacterium]
MKKVLSSALVALMVVLSGCTSEETSSVETVKNDQEQIQESFQSVISGDETKLSILEPDLLKDKMVAHGESRHKLLLNKGVLDGECSLNISSVDGTWAKVFVKCATVGGDAFMEKTDGQWKLLVIK